MSRDICQVISQLKSRWLDCYGDHLGTEEIRRAMSSMLCEQQARELRGVFSSWTAQELADGIRAAGDIGDDDNDMIAVETPEAPPAPVVLKEAPKVVVRRVRRTHAELAAAGHPAYVNTK